jgi:hypothetical protein
MFCELLANLEDERARLTSAVVLQDARTRNVSAIGTPEEWAREAEELDRLTRELRGADRAYLLHRDEHRCGRLVS